MVTIVAGAIAKLGVKVSAPAPGGAIVHCSAGVVATNRHCNSAGETVARRPRTALADIDGMIPRGRGPIS
jgi:hypothetical protein